MKNSDLESSVLHSQLEDHWKRVHIGLGRGNQTSVRGVLGHEWEMFYSITTMASSDNEHCVRVVERLVVRMSESSGREPNYRQRRTYRPTGGF